MQTTREVTAKVRVGNVISMDGGKQISFYPDYEDGRNKDWALATPNISLSMTVKDGPAADILGIIGQSFTLTFTPEN